MSESEIVLPRATDRFMGMYKGDMESVKTPTRHRKEVLPFPVESKARYVTPETLREDAIWLQEIEEESAKKMTGPIDGIHDQVIYCAKHVKGAIDPDDRSVFYGIKVEGDNLGGYVQSYRPERSERAKARDRANAFIKEMKGEQARSIITRSTTVREVSLFRQEEDGVTQEDMIEGMRDALLTDAKRFANRNDRLDIAYIAFEDPKDAEREAVLSAVGFVNMGLVDVVLDMPDPKHKGETMEVPAKNNLWVLSPVLE